MAANNTPPQYVFEIVAIEAIKKFLAVDVPPEEVAKFFATLVAAAAVHEDRLEEWLQENNDQVSIACVLRVLPV
jgi:hypothetical protein